MTCLEKFKLDYPDISAVYTDELICFTNCPDTTGYISDSTIKQFCDDYECHKCWAQEVED